MGGRSEGEETYGISGLARPSGGWKRSVSYPVYE
jgi:hypothetical protein